MVFEKKKNVANIYFILSYFSHFGKKMHKKKNPIKDYMKYLRLGNAKVISFH
jgi:hypothetical protein